MKKYEKQKEKELDRVRKAGFGDRRLEGDIVEAESLSEIVVPRRKQLELR